MKPRIGLITMGGMTFYTVLIMGGSFNPKWEGWKPLMAYLARLNRGLV